MGYNKERYAKDEEYKEHIKQQIKAYQQRVKGKLAREKYAKKFKKKHPDYIKKYMKKKRDEARIKKICMRCFKNPAEKDFVLCKDCLAR